MLPFLAQGGHELLEADGEVRFGQDFLRGERIADKVLGEEVPEHGRIVHFAGGPDESLRKFDAAGDQAVADLLQIPSQVVAGLLVIKNSLERRGPSYEVRLGLLEPSELHPPQALQDELAGAVRLPHAGAHETGSGHGEDGFLPGVRSHHAHGENTIASQHRGQHLPVARLENVKRQQRVGKQRDPA